MSIKHYVQASEQPKGRAKERICWLFHKWAEVHEWMAAGRSFGLKQLVISGISPTVMTQ